MDDEYDINDIGSGYNTGFLNLEDSNYGQSYGPDAPTYLQQSNQGDPVGDWFGESSSIFPEGETQFGGYGISYDPNSQYMLSGIGNQNYSGYSSPIPDTGVPQITNGNSDFLSRLFANPTMFMKGLGALFEGAQNKKYASSLNGIASRLQAAGDPFASQRGQYQQMLSDTYTNPNVVLGRPEIAAQLRGMQEQMDRKDAVAGRRSQYGDRLNQLTMQSAGLVDKYRQQLAQLAGAGISPNLSGLAQLLQGGAQANANGYLSPLASFFGNTTRNEANTDAIASALEKILKSK